MQVIFIHHSCFLVEVDEKVLIFDWFAGDRIKGYTFHGVIPEYEPDTPVYVFASHKHQDHFDMDVPHWAEKYKNIHYILSKDCKMSPHFYRNMDSRMISERRSLMFRQAKNIRWMM